MIECNDILNNWYEILFFVVVDNYMYFCDIVFFILDFDDGVEIEFLIGRDLVIVYYVLD